MSKNKQFYISKCCGAKVEVVTSPDDIDKIGCTMYYKCCKCNCACNIMINQRKTWNINPKTKIQGDHREKTKKELTEKEIREIKRTEEF